MDFEDSFTGDRFRLAGSGPSHSSGHRIRRVVVIGTSGSGKSTLARAIAARLGLPFVPSDDFWWEAGWNPAPISAVGARVAAAVSEESWVLESNFDRWRDLVWRSADLVVWLDYGRFTVLRAVLARNLWWAVTRAVVWSGNRMTLRRAFSGVRHAMASFGPKRRLYRGWLDELGVPLVRFCSRRECARWLKALPSVLRRSHSAIALFARQGCIQGWQANRATRAEL